MRNKWSLWPVILFVILVFPCFPAAVQGKDTEIILKGAGATFPHPLYKEWMNVYKAEAGIRMSYQAIGVLAAGVAHDFNNLLAVVMGNIGLAKRFVNTNDKIFSLLDKAEKGADRATGLSQQLLTFSKGDPLVKETASIREIIEDSANFVLRGSATRCDYSFQDNLFPVDVDKGQISQVLREVINE
jgi:signal transduction histidine kinase